jgi:RND superfamily putative drug exporter
MRHVALCDVGALENADGDLTVGEVLAERMELSGPWWRPGASRRQVDAWVARTASALDAHEVRGPALAADVSLTSLNSAQRAAVLVAAALAERAGVVFIDLGDRIPDGSALTTFVNVIETLAPSSTTVVLGSLALAPDTALRVDRACVTTDLDTLTRKAVLR